MKLAVCAVEPFVAEQELSATASCGESVAKWLVQWMLYEVAWGRWRLPDYSRSACAEVAWREYAHQ